MNEQGMRIEDAVDQLVIRSAVSDDAECLNHWWNDGAVMAHAGFPLGLGEPLEKTKRQIESNKEHLSQRCIIEYQQERIGEMSYSIQKIEKSESDCQTDAAKNEKPDSDCQTYAAEIGIKICESQYQNRGLGTKLLTMLIDYLFTDETLNQAAPIQKIILDTNLKNVRAQHVYETIGFEKIAIHHNAWKDQLGVSQDSVDYVMTRKQYEDGVRYITEEALKEEIAKHTLNLLPDWFGLPDATKEYIEQSKTMPFFAYYKDNQYVGFIALKETGPVTAEVYVMGILQEYHRQGIGKMLMKQLYAYASRKKYEFLQVKTVDAGHYKEYDQSRMFYEKMGFRKFEVFPTLWDEWNPCLVMVMAIKPYDPFKLIQES